MNLKINSQLSFGNINIKKNASNNNRNNTIYNPANNNDIAATLKVSRLAKSQARILEESKIIKEQSEKTINDIIDTIKTGGTLSKKEQQIFDNELRSMGKDYYNEMKDFRIDTSDPKNLAFLKDHFMQRIDMYVDMQEKVKLQEADNDSSSDNVMLAMAKIDNDEKEELIEVLEESLDDETDDEKTKESEASQELESEESLDTEEKPFEEVDVSTDMKAFDKIQNNKESIKNMKTQSQNETNAMREYDNMLNAEYAKLLKTLESDEISNEEKVDTYNKYLENSKEFAYRREEERIKSQFDFETWLVNKIQFLAHDEISEVETSGMNLSNAISKEFAELFFK